ncbi:histidinol-phosphate transaminase [Oscillospiraceae bacterium CM]|nr:histidinol-phosphate transaminase [Oscillospiraceae bacterium CM]
MSRFLSKRLSDLVPYVPGEQPTDMAYIKLNTNESPYPPSPMVLERLVSAALDKLNLYPDPTGKALRQKIAAQYGLEPENVFLSNGSDEALAFAFMAFCDEKTPAAFADVTYGFYPVYCDLFGIPRAVIPLRSDFTLCADDYVGIGKTIIIANPNAPTGLAVSLDAIEKILAANPDNVVIVDEAYVDFGGDTAVGLIQKYDNLLVVQTCSKSRSLAGARLGFAFGCKALIDDIDAVRYSFNSYNVSRPALLAGEAAFDDAAYYDAMCRRVIATREKTAEGLKALGFQMTASVANFLFARHPEASGGDLYRQLKARGILVRHFDKNRISDYLRITIGTPEQMKALLSALAVILGRET